jgi:hypothetical protein
MKKVELFEQYIAEKKKNESQKKTIQGNLKIVKIPIYDGVYQVIDQDGTGTVWHQGSYSDCKKYIRKNESAVTEARAPKTKEELISALKDAIKKEKQDNKGKFETSFPTRDLREIENTKDLKDLSNSAKKVLSGLKKKYSIKESIDESVINEARAPKTKEELISSLDDAYSKLDKYNKKYYEINRAPGGGSWSSSSKEGKAALKYKKMAGNQQANIWKWTDKLRKLGFEYNTNEAVVNEGQADVNKSYDKVIELIRKEARRLNDDDAYEFHERLKEFFNKTI